LQEKYLIGKIIVLVADWP